MNSEQLRSEMGFNVSKPKRILPLEAQSLGDNEKRSASLEVIANEYMKHDSYRRSHHKYGVDLRADEVAEDEPSEVVHRNDALSPLLE